MLNETEEINEAQDEAFEKLLELGGEDRWVSVDELGAHHQTVRALVRRKVVQLKEEDEQEYVAVAGVLLEEIPENQ